MGGVLPIVLVGHTEAGIPVHAYADLCPDELARVMATEKSNNLDAARAGFRPAPRS